MSLLPKVRALLSRHGLSPRKALSQNFLIDPRVIEREAKAAQVNGKRVLEIGPGLGFLTRELLKHAKEVIAVEKDAGMVSLLSGELPDPKLTILHEDFLKWKPEPVDVVVSNVPYSISSPLLFKLAKLDFNHALLCLQKEFADRMLANPGTKEYSRLSVMSQLLFEIEDAGRVPATAFFPKPRVESRIVLLRKRHNVKISAWEEKVISALFQHRRKTVRAALKVSLRALELSSESLESVPFSERRVFSLAKGELLQIARALE